MRLRMTRGAYSSQNEQDSRFYAKFAKIPCLEPSDSQEARDMTIMAFELSEKVGLPVMLRTVTRISHACSAVEIGPIREQNALLLQKDPANMIAVPSNVVRCHRNLNEKQNALKQWGEESGLNKTFKKDQKKGIITCGIGYVYAKEYGPEYALLKISYYPVAETLIEEFVKGLDEVWVLEEGEPYIEEIARRYSSRVKGKMSGEISNTGELGPDVLTPYIPGRGVAPDSYKPSTPLPSRPPVLCPGCPHSKLYTALRSGPAYVHRRRHRLLYTRCESSLSDSGYLPLHGSGHQQGSRNFQTRSKKSGRSHWRFHLHSLRNPCVD